jgi:hypothetical protein
VETDVRPKWAGNLLALILGLVVALLLAEIVARIAGPGPPAPHPPVRLNELGYRDKKHEAAKPPGVVRIAFVGDSYTFGVGLAEEDRFSNVVARRLDVEWPQVQVEGLNFGWPGADSDGNLNELRNSVPVYDSDAIVYGFVLNDYFTAEGLVAYHARLEELEQRYRRNWSWLVSLAEHSRAADLVNTLLRYRYSGLRENQTGHLADLYKPSGARRRGSGVLDEAMAEMERVRRGVVVFFPVFLEDESELEFYARARRLVREASARHGHSFIELLPHLAHRPYHEWWVSETDHHPNAAAHEIAAELIVEALLRGEPLAETARR